MADTTSAPQGGATADDRVRGIDWEAIERSPEFQELVKRLIDSAGSAVWHSALASS